MMFNTAADRGYALTFKELKEALKMDDDTLTKNLKSMMMIKFKLLEVRATEAVTSGKQTPSGGMQFRDDTVFGTNEAFTNQLNRIVFPTPVLEEVYKKGKKCKIFSYS